MTSLPPSVKPMLAMEVTRPPESEALPLAPSKTSLPAPPVIVSSPVPPMIRVLPRPALMVFTPPRVRSDVAPRICQDGPYWTFGSEDRPLNP